jgi:hypothetical protein
MGRNIKDYTGFVKGYITAISFAGICENKSTWTCICNKCGSEFVAKVRVFSSSQKTCGCLRKSQYLTPKHGYARKKSISSSEYSAWNSMKRRCYNINNEDYHNYGGRGIVVCDEWINSFKNFLADIGEKPSNFHSLDRVDVNGNYSKANCRWATKLEQSNNRRNSFFVTYNEIKMTIAEVAKKENINRSTLRSVILQKKITAEEAVSKIKNKQKGK